MEAIRLLLVDDQQLFVENLKTVLELTAEDFEVTGIAANGRDALKLLETRKPEIVLMDVRMPVMDGVEATRAIRERGYDVKILMLTTFDNDDYVRDALKAGADGYILKNIPPQKLFDSIRAMRSGGVLISPEVAYKVAAWDNHSDAERANDPVERNAAQSVFESLSGREREIIEHIALAYTNREIADRMCISEQTVKNHITRVYSKLGVTRRAQLMKLYSEHRV